MKNYTLTKNKLVCIIEDYYHKNKDEINEIHPTKDASIRVKKSDADIYKNVDRDHGAWVELVPTEVPPKRKIYRMTQKQFATVIKQVSKETNN